VRDFHKLLVLERSHHLTLALYHATEDFPKSEVFGLTSQIRRALHPFPLIWRKAVAVGETAIWAVSYKSRWARRANWIT
jgi:hypothetical protein